MGVLHQVRNLCGIPQPLQDRCGFAGGGDSCCGVPQCAGDGFNRRFDLVTVVPLTKLEEKKRRVYTFEVLAPDLIGTGHKSIIMPQQVRTVSRKRLLGPIGALTDSRLRGGLENRLIDHPGIEFEPEEL